MPTYEYTCKACDEHLEVVQSFKDTALTECPACGGPLRKVFGNIGIAFKGSGFYKTDSRSDARKATSSSSEPKTATPTGADGGGAAPKAGTSKEPGTKATTNSGASSSGTSAARATAAT